MPNWRKNRDISNDAEARLETCTREKLTFFFCHLRMLSSAALICLFWESKTDAVYITSLIIKCTEHANAELIAKVI